MTTSRFSIGSGTPGRLAARLGVMLVFGVLPAGWAATRSATDVAWAVNVGGPAYEAIDGTRYEAEASVAGGQKGRMETIKGSQDPLLYTTYRAGDIRVDHPIANGTYDVTFHFAEPEELGPGARLFDAYAEGRLVIDDLDVKSFRDGKAESGLTITVPNLEVADGELNVTFEASAMEPILSALVVRDKSRPRPPWELVWKDEFDGDELDEAKWTARDWPPRKVNDEDQAYTPRTRNLRLEDGMLVIEAHREDYEGGKYTSGRITSAGKGDFLYGRFEARARLPRGQGTWPAIWMLPSDPFAYATTCDAGEWQGNPDCDAWPNSGEIDIMEHVGYQMNHVHGTVHTQGLLLAGLGAAQGPRPARRRCRRLPRLRGRMDAGADRRLRRRHALLQLRERAQGLEGMAVRQALPPDPEPRGRRRLGPGRGAHRRHRLPAADADRLRARVSAGRRWASTRRACRKCQAGLSRRSPLLTNRTGSYRGVSPARRGSRAPSARSGRSSA